MCFSLGNGFLYINKHVSKQICPVCLQGWKDWIHAPVEAPFGGWGWGGGLHPFCFGVSLFNPHSPLIFSPYLGLVLSPSCLWTCMSRNSSLESQAFVKRASTGNRLLSIDMSADYPSTHRPTLSGNSWSTIPQHIGQHVDQELARSTGSRLICRSI